MREIEVMFTGSPESIPKTVEEICEREGLTLVLKGTLAKYPGCVHWHFKRGRLPGTLEVTWWKSRLWFKISAGRDAAWMDNVIEKLQMQL